MSGKLVVVPISAFAERFPIGSPVIVLTRYRGSGVFAADGDEGRWFIVGHLSPDLKLARHPNDDYEIICHVMRIEGAPEASWHKDQKP